MAEFPRQSVPSRWLASSNLGSSASLTTEYRSVIVARPLAHSSNGLSLNQGQIGLEAPGRRIDALLVANVRPPTEIEAE